MLALMLFVEGLVVCFIVLLACVVGIQNGAQGLIFLYEKDVQERAIDCYGVGDAIATSKANPCFGNVYKLVQIDGLPVLKRSEDKVKLINPGFQITYRIMKHDEEKGDIFKLDVTCLRGDSLCEKIERGEEITVYDEYDRYKFKTFPAGGYTATALQIPAIIEGKRTAPRRSLGEKKEYYKYSLMHFSPSERRLINPHYYKVDISDDLADKKHEIISRLVKEINEFKEL